MTATTDMQPPARLAHLDLFKTVLVCGMVTAHVIQLLGSRLGPGLIEFAEFINLLAFSGFMLAFGVGLGASRDRDRPRPLLWRFRPAIVMLASVYLSSLAFVVLVERGRVTQALLLDMLTLRVLFGYSEFLATFFVLYVLVALARPVFRAVAAHPAGLLVAVLVCLATTWIETDWIVPLAGTIVGNTNFATFPLLPYLPWFLLGIHLGMRQQGSPNLLVLLLALCATSAFAAWSSGELPQRFPPTILWVLGPALPLLLGLAACKSMSERVQISQLALVIGRHVLLALLLSNVAIFALRFRFGTPIRADWAAILASLALLVAIFGAALLREHAPRWFARKRAA